MALRLHRGFVSDPIDPLAVGGSGLAGAGFVAALVRYLIGGAIADLKEKLGEFRADVREQLSSLKDDLDKSNERHDKNIAEVAQLGMKVNALHQRLDTMEHEQRELERRMDRGDK